MQYCSIILLSLQLKVYAYNENRDQIESVPVALLFIYLKSIFSHNILTVSNVTKTIVRDCILILQDFTYM